MDGAGTVHVQESMGVDIVCSVGCYWIKILATRGWLGWPAGGPNQGGIWLGRFRVEGHQPLLHQSSFNQNSRLL